MAGLGLSLVDPGLVDLHGVGADAEGAVLQHLPDGGAQDFLQSVLASGVAVEAHQHLDDGGVTSDHLLRLVHLQPRRRDRETSLTGW